MKNKNSARPTLTGPSARFLSPHRISRQEGLSYQATLKLIADGVIPSVKIGTRRRVHVEALANYMAAVKSGKSTA